MFGQRGEYGVSRDQIVRPQRDRGSRYLMSWACHYLGFKTFMEARHEPQMNCWNGRWTQLTGNYRKGPMAVRRACCG